MSSKRDYYEVLGVSRSAEAEEIKKAYRRCALSHHPDRNPGDKVSEEKFKEATEAYQVLSDSQKRQVYDQYGPEGLSQSGGFGFSSGGFGDIFEDIFTDFFGGGSTGGRGKSRASQKGRDLQYEMEISFEEAAFGVEKKVEIERLENCSVCKGEGRKPGTEIKTCKTCRGSGQVMAQSGIFSIARACPTCRGMGSFVESPCEACHGQGRSNERRKINIKIPAGIDDQSRMRMNGEGESGFQGGRRGDLYVDIHVEPHVLLTRKGDDVLCEMPISFVQAALGAEVEVPTLTGKASLKIPAGTQRGQGIQTERQRHRLLTRVWDRGPVRSSDS